MYIEDWFPSSVAAVGGDSVDGTTMRQPARRRSWASVACRKVRVSTYCCIHVFYLLGTRATAVLCYVVSCFTSSSGSFPFSLVHVFGSFLPFFLVFFRFLRFFFLAVCCCCSSLIIFMFPSFFPPYVFHPFVCFVRFSCFVSFFVLPPDRVSLVSVT